MKLKTLIILLFLGTICTYPAYLIYRNYKTQKVINEYYALPYYQYRIDQFKSTNFADSSVVFIGNSITEEFKLSVFQSSRIYNFGISGDFSQGLLKRVGLVTSLKPSQIFVMIGINDIVEKVPLKEIQKNYSETIQQIKKESPQTQIFVQSVLPIRGFNSFMTSNSELIEKIKEMNIFLKTSSAEWQAQYVDLFSLLIDEKNQLKASLTYDGVHLTDEGYKIWIKEIEHLVQK